MARRRQPWRSAGPSNGRSAAEQVRALLERPRVADRPLGAHLCSYLDERLCCLLACAACRAVPTLAYSPELLEGLERIEAMADGQAPAEALARPVAGLGRWPGLGWLVEAVHAAGVGVPRAYAEAMEHAARAARDAAGMMDWRAALDTQLALARDLLGDLFTELPEAPRWAAHPAVRHMALAIYEDRSFEELPVLGDALEDAGCDHEAILAHCRGPGPHARGCWVLDCILDRE